MDFIKYLSQVTFCNLIVSGENTNDNMLTTTKVIVQNRHTVHTGSTQNVPNQNTVSDHASTQSSNSSRTSMKTDDNWVVVVRRVSGAVNFTRPWKDYVAGFGDPGGNFWIG